MTEVLPLVYFTHADLKSKENLDANLEYIETASSGPKNGFGTGISKRARKRMKLTIRDENMSYEAVEEDDQPFMVGVLDKESGNISVRNTAYFLLKPECYISSKLDSNTKLSVDQNVSYSEKLNSLTAAFGSSKKRKAMQTKLKNKIDIDTLETAVGNAIEESKRVALTKPVHEAVNSYGNNADSDTMNNLEQFSIMPVPNAKAKTPNEVYLLNEALCVELAELDRYTLELSKKFAVATNEAIKTWKDNAVYPEYVCEYLSKLINSKSNQKYRIEKCKQIAYINYLILLYKLKAAQLRTKSPMHAYEVPDSAINKMFTLYTVTSNANAQAKMMRTMPRRLKDKLTCHILVLALHLEDFSCPLELLQKDLKLSMQRLSDFCQALGCFVRSQIATVNKKKVVTKTANLTLPLNDAAKVQAKKRARKN